MIAPLRRRHRWMFSASALILAPLLALSLTGRADIPLQVPVGDAGAEGLRPFAELDAELTASADRWTLELDEPLRKPDVLAYWSAEPVADGNLPTGAFLLGSVSAFRVNSFLPPEPAQGRDGHLILYSLGHQEVVASGPIAASFSGGNS